MATFTSSDIAFVTGAGSGIGRATCQLLAKEGATVVAADINKKGADETVLGLAGKNHMSIRLDVTKKDDVAKAISEVIAKYSSPPNIAVNCAGLILCEPLLDLTEETYNKLSDVNVKGTFWVTQAVIRELVAAQKKGAIVNIASIAKSGYALTTLYGANKAAVETFSLAAGREFGPQGIRVNTISPGFTDTPMMVPFPEEFKKIYVNDNPLKRPAKPEEIAETICFLVSEKSAYVNATSMFVHGGCIC